MLFKHILTYISNRYLKGTLYLYNNLLCVKINYFHCSMRLSKILGICALLFEDFSILFYLDMNLLINKHFMIEISVQLQQKT